MPESIPKHRPGVAITHHAAAAIVGARFVSLTGAEPVGGTPVVAPSGAAARTVEGVSAQDAAAGEKVGVHNAEGQHIPVEAGAALVAGNLVAPGAGGVAVVAAAGVHVWGIVVQGAGAGAQAIIKFGYAGIA